MKRMKRNRRTIWKEQKVKLYRKEMRVGEVRKTQGRKEIIGEEC